MFIQSASASESSGVIGPTSRRIRPRLSSRCVRSRGSSGRSGVRARTSVLRLSLPMARIESIRELPHPPERVFEFLSDLHNHWQLEDSFIAVDGVRDGGGRILIRGPLGITREARTEVVAADPPSRFVGRATLGTTIGRVAWEIRPSGPGSLVSLSAEVERASAADRLLFALGGRRWLRRRFANVLATLDRGLG